MTDARSELGPLRYRSPELIAAILGHIYEARGPVPWLDVVDVHTNDRWEWQTVENVIYNLIEFGALHRIGKPGTSRTPDRRALKATHLGRAWLAGEILPLPTKEQTP